VLREIFRLNREKVTGESSILESFMTCTPHQVLLRYPIRDDERAGHIARMAEQRHA
jgi:hypothetical protein